MEKRGGRGLKKRVRLRADRLGGVPVHGKVVNVLGWWEGGKVG